MCRPLSLREVQQSGRKISLSTKLFQGEGAKKGPMGLWWNHATKGLAKKE
jgi:hypothetical protein